MEKSKYIIALLIVVIICSISFFLFELNKQSNIIESQKKLIVKLTPRFNGQDTLSLLNAMLNLKEFDYNTKLLDTSKRIKIIMYPYITKEYKLLKFNKPVWVVEDYPAPHQNAFLIDRFTFFENDSARIEYRFGNGWMGLMDAQKINREWKIIKSEIGRY